MKNTIITKYSEIFWCIKFNIFWSLEKYIILNKSNYFTIVTSPVISLHIYCISIDGNVMHGIQKNHLKSDVTWHEWQFGIKTIKMILIPNTANQRTCIHYFIIIIYIIIYIFVDIYQITILWYNNVYNNNY